MILPISKLVLETFLLIYKAHTNRDSHSKDHWSISLIAFWNSSIVCSQTSSVRTPQDLQRVAKLIFSKQLQDSAMQF